MKAFWAIAASAVAVIVVGSGVPGAAAAAATGTIKGRVVLSGKSPGNTVIRMGVDPMCSRLYAGKRAVNEVVTTSDDGGLANAFVKLAGAFPESAVPPAPVLVDQTACIYHPRVVGARVGQTLRVKNSDNLLHNVHSSSTGANQFNVGQPVAGVTYDYRLKGEEMLQLKCDVHRWMTAWVGVVSHPYFAVSGGDGSFTIANVPAGKRTIGAWHERFGNLTQAVDVKAGGTTTVTFTYKAAATPGA